MKQIEAKTTLSMNAIIHHLMTFKIRIHDKNAENVKQELEHSIIKHANLWKILDFSYGISHATLTLINDDKMSSCVVQ